MKRLAYSILSLFIISVSIVITGLQSCKHEPNTINGDKPIIPQDTSKILNGAILYANNCAGCHNPLATTSKPGATASQILIGINSINGMKSLSFLTTIQIQAIADTLKKISHTPSLDGATLYTNNCASCHGSLASSSKIGTSAALILTGINTISSMKSLSFLTAAQIQAIADTLKTTSPTPSLDGATLYANNCASCHGTLATSAKRGATAAQILTGINIVSGMKSLSFLTTAQIQAIADTLRTSSPPTLDGAALYAGNCASCHGPLTSSSKLGRSSTQIQNAINTINAMKTLSSLSSAQIQAIADTLKSTMPAPSNGGTLYASYCAGCHGVLASSSKLGATVQRIQNGINTVSDMKTLSSLTADQIKQISDTLISTPMPTDGPSLYGVNCARCHGILANSRVGGTSVSEIQNAIIEVSQMNYLSVLTPTQIQAIAGALANIQGGGD